MAYLIEIELLRSHIKWPQPKPEKETADALEEESLPEESATRCQKEFDLA